LGRTIKKPAVAEIKTPADALAVSLNEKGKLDLDHIGELLNQTSEEVIEGMGELIYEERG